MSSIGNNNQKVQLEQQRVSRAVHPETVVTGAQWFPFSLSVESLVYGSLACILALVLV